jgi:hypothetical protein
MFAAAVYPLLPGTLAFDVPSASRHFAVVTGCALALLIGVSRVVVDAHSVSEVLAGLLVGGTATAVVLTLVHLPSGLIDPAPCRGCAMARAHAGALKTHSVVMRLSLLSGHKTPYTRGAMLLELRRRQSAPREPPTCAPPTIAPIEA